MIEQDLQLVKEQDYLSQHGNAVTFSSGSWPDLRNAYVEFQGLGTRLPMDVTSESSVALGLRGRSTTGLKLNKYKYRVVAHLSDGSRAVLAIGRVIFV